MKKLFYKFWENIIDSFKGYNILFHILAVASTYLIVISDFDWKYFLFWRGTNVYYILFSAAPIGMLFPILVPSALLVLGKIKKNIRLQNTAFALGQAAILGVIISGVYKAFTGRLHPSLAESLTNNITHVFQFGFLHGGVFWGWPSTHATMAFAMALTLWMLYKENKIIKTTAIFYALYVGIGVSMTIHWFSDFTAGAIIGTVIGIVVGKAFRDKTDFLVK